MTFSGYLLDSGAQHERPDGVRDLGPGRRAGAARTRKALATTPVVPLATVPA